MLVANTGAVDEISRASVALKYYLSPGAFLHLEYSAQDNRFGYPAAANGAARALDVDSHMIMAMFVIDW